MKKSVFRISGFIVLAFIIIASGCKKGDADSQSAEDAARGSYIMADAFSIASDANSGKLNKRFSLECFSIDTSFVGGFRITFNQCTDEYGVYRDGSIAVTASDDAWGENSTATISITFENYVQDNEGISGTITARAGQGALGIYFTLGATELKLTYADGDIAIINSAELTWTISIAGLEYNGHSSGVTREGVSYSSVCNDLVFGFCSWPVSGTMTVDVDGENEITINFDQDGSAPCDNIYLVSQKRHRDVEVTF